MSWPVPIGVSPAPSSVAQSVRLSLYYFNFYYLRRPGVGYVIVLSLIHSVNRISGGNGRRPIKLGSWW